MPYQISFTDFANKSAITIEDGTINQSTSLNLPGKNTTAYGTAIAENFLHLLENFASATEPNSPVQGQLWFDSTPGNEQLKIYNGSNWIPANGINKDTQQPAYSQEGDLWVDKDSQQLYLYTDASGWILIGPEFSQGLLTGISPKAIYGTDDQEYNVLQIDISSKPAAIITTSSFTPKIKIDGFVTLNPGINLSSKNITGDNYLKYYGIAEKAESLIVGQQSVLASNFLRGDSKSTSYFPIDIRDNNGINFGINSELSIGVEGNAGIIKNNVGGSSIDVKVKNDGIYKTLLRLDSSLNIGVNNEAPEESLDVIGNIKISPSIAQPNDGNLNVTGVTQSSSITTGSLITAGGVGIAKNVNIGGDLSVGIVGNDYIGSQIIANKIVPLSDNTGNIGTNDLRYNEIYASKFYGDITGNVTGTVSGVAGSANRLASSTTFRFIGDITLEQDIIYTGQGGTTQFNTLLANTFIANKDEVLVNQPDDEIIVNRIRNDTGLKKIQIQRLLSTVPTPPIGMITPYAGQSAPTNWLLCFGQEVAIADYLQLFDLIGYTYKAQNLLINPTGYFALPDFRGRFGVGADNMGGSAANNVPDATTLGSISGSNEREILVSNLPDHKHNLQSPSGSQFYATRDVNAIPDVDDTNVINYDASTATLAGQALADSGTVISDGNLNVPLDIMNPYITVNYIIYAGTG